MRLCGILTEVTHKETKLESELFANVLLGRPEKKITAVKDPEQPLAQHELTGVMVVI